MPVFTPLKGTKNGYDYQFVDRVGMSTTYVLNAPGGQSAMVNCFTREEIQELTSDPEAFWKKHNK